MVKKSFVYVMVILCCITAIVFQFNVENNSTKESGLKQDGSTGKITESEYTEADKIKNITYAFDEFELYLKPQAAHLISDFYNLNEVKPNVYELIDDTLLIYYFKDKEALIKGVEQIKEIFHTDFFYKYTTEDNILIIYRPHEYQPYQDCLKAANKTNNKIQEIIKYRYSRLKLNLYQETFSIG